MAHLSVHIASHISAFTFINVLTFARAIVLTVSTRTLTAKRNTNIWTNFKLKHIFNRLLGAIGRRIGAFVITFTRYFLTRSFVVLQSIARFTFALNLRVAGIFTNLFTQSNRFTTKIHCNRDNQKTFQTLRNSFLISTVVTHYHRWVRLCRRWFSFRCNNNWTNRQTAIHIAIPLHTFLASHRESVPPYTLHSNFYRIHCPYHCSYCDNRVHLWPTSRPLYNGRYVGGWHNKFPTNTNRR